MVKKAIVALACVLIASPAFAQTTTHRTRYHRTTTALTTVEGVTVTAPIIATQGGSVAAYQPAGMLVIRTDTRIQNVSTYLGPGLSMISLAEPYAGRLNPARGWWCFTPIRVTGVWLIT